MKRLPEPAIINIHNPAKTDYRVTREALPLQWLASELLYHTLFLYTDVHGDITVRSIIDFASAVPRGTEISERTDREYAVFLDLYDDCSDKNTIIVNTFMETVPEAEKNSWKELPVLEGTQAYIDRRNAGAPQYQKLIDAGRFFIGEYRHLPDDIRTMTDLAFSGLLFTALTDPDFSSLCKDKSLDVSGMTLEQKMDAPLDHEALYGFLLNKLKVEA